MEVRIPPEPRTRQRINEDHHPERNNGVGNHRREDNNRNPNPPRRER